MGNILWMLNLLCVHLAQDRLEFKRSILIQHFFGFFKKMQSLTIQQHIKSLGL